MIPTSQGGAWRCEQWIVLASLLGITLLAWAYLGALARDMPDMAMGDAMAGMMAPHRRWDAAQYVLTALMWAVMMVGMMLPSAAPMILLFAVTQRRHVARPYLRVALFVSGYLLLWGGFAIAAASLQGLLAETALLSPMLAVTSPLLGGSIFLAAGLYEWTPLKNRCLNHCRGPLAFITGHWRPGAWGALRMGIAHGAFCLGCCWVLMLLLFIGGVMNLLWVALLAALVMLQKLLPGGRLVPLLTGTAMAAAGLLLLGRAIF